MTLPLAIVSRWPLQEYADQHPGNLVAALQHINVDALFLYYEIEELKKQFQHTNNKDDKRIDKNLDLELREKEERLFRLLKFNDYPAMAMAFNFKPKYMDSKEYKRVKDNIIDPILIRGISSGDYAKHAEAVGRDYYFMETGYLGNYRSVNNSSGRKVYHRMEKNAMQQSRILDVPDDRWRELCKFNPSLFYKGWKKDPGSKILIIMSTDKPFEYYGTTKKAWIESTIKTLKENTDREIIIREKASRGERTNNTIYDALAQDVHAVVTYNSIAAIEAIHYGIPAFCTAPTAASSVTTSDLSQIETPIKLHEDIIYKWLSSIAYGQFSVNEILTGRAWKLVQENDQRPTFNY